MYPGKELCFACWKSDWLSAKHVRHDAFLHVAGAVMAFQRFVDDGLLTLADLVLRNRRCEPHERCFAFVARRPVEAARDLEGGGDRKLRDNLMILTCKLL